MRKMQDVVLKEIENTTKDFGLELVVNFGATNTGKGFMMDGIKTVLSFTFSFQTSYCSIVIYNQKNEGIKNNSYLKYHKSNELEDLLNFIHQELDCYDMDKAIAMAERDNGRAI